MDDKTKVKLLTELQQQAFIDRPKNRSIAAIWMFEDTKILLMLPKEHPFTLWLARNNAIVPESRMLNYKLWDYVRDGWVMLNPLVLSSGKKHPYTFYANTFVVKRLQKILDQYGVDSTFAEEKMTNNAYAHLLNYFDDLY